MKMKDESKKDKNAWHSVWHERLDEQHVKYAAKDAYASYETYMRIIDMRECLLPATNEGSSHRAVAGASQEVEDYTIVSPSLECIQLFIEVCANDLYSHLCNWMFISVISQTSHGLLAAIICVIIGLHTHF